MIYLIVAFAAGVMTTSAIKLLTFNWRAEKLNHLENELRLSEIELKEAKWLLRVREDQRDEAEDITETMGERITFLESENKRLQGYETAVRELNRSVEILAEDVPF